ncbi:hypothetical protein SNEBB_006534 [Seison nebaliae]|nr:hypothetical protein SNEBB_006534 [Seison nebaliae]
MFDVLVTGGTGFIGSNTCKIILEEMTVFQLRIVVVDNGSNSDVDHISTILTQMAKPTKHELVVVKMDCCNKDELFEIFEKYSFHVIIHFAGLKAVAQSIEEPVEYYRNNLTSTMNLLSAMEKFDCKRIIFSSSSTVYGTPNELPITEAHITGQNITNPYGQTKYMSEIFLKDCSWTHPHWICVALRYFNPVGADSTGTLGEKPVGPPNNLMPYVAQVAAGILPHLNVFGVDYPTDDGTGVRDYIHVVDLAKGHVAVLNHMLYGEARPGFHPYNLGTGFGTSVLEMVKEFERVSERPIKYELKGRRYGDLATVYADSSLARECFQWKAKLTVGDMCRDLWNFQKKFLLEEKK